MSRFDNARAISEGWLINERSDAPAFAIEKLDNPSEHPGSNGRTFASDQHAYVHVVAQARAGSGYHKDALAFLQQHAPVAHCWAVDEFEYVRSAAAALAAAVAA